MQQRLSAGMPALGAPTFYLTGRQPLRPGAIVAATVAVIGALALILYVMSHGEHANLKSGGSGSDHTTAGAASADEKDDPSQIDTIVLGDPGDPPAPARRGDHVSPVHPTIIVHLPRFGEQVGLTPDTPAGRLLYGWLAAFNQSSFPALGDALPNVAVGLAVAAEIHLREQTGGFKLVSAKEVEPGILVFRLRDQTPSAREVLGTLQVLPDSNPASIASFSLGAASLGHDTIRETAPR